jgi:hypothetical protein
LENEYNIPQEIHDATSIVEPTPYYIQECYINHIEEEDKIALALFLEH